MIKSLPEDVRTMLRSGIAICSLQQCLEELVLNSLDSGATCVAIKVDVNACKLQVTDNGSGIDRNNLEIIGTRYCTSKCETLEDFSCLQSYGYRGEALASIVSLSSVVEISTRTKLSLKTFVKVFSSGNSVWISEAQESRPSAGTTITVSDFFHNVPVRRKRLDPALEMERTRLKIEAISLMHPSVSFTMKRECKGSMMVQLSKVRSTCSRFAQIHGSHKAQKLREIAHVRGQIVINGLISLDGHSTNNLQYLFLNGRHLLNTNMHKHFKSMWMKCMISNRLAVLSKDCSRGELHGAYVINIRCPLSEYDISFEPSKTLVEFKDWDSVLCCIEEGFSVFLERNSHGVNLDDLCSSLDPLLEMQQNRPAVLGTCEDYNSPGFDHVEGTALTSKVVFRKKAAVLSGKVEEAPTNLKMAKKVKLNSEGVIIQSAEVADKSPKPAFSTKYKLGDKQPIHSTNCLSVDCEVKPNITEHTWRKKEERTKPLTKLGSSIGTREAKLLKKYTMPHAALSPLSKCRKLNVKSTIEPFLYQEPDQHTESHLPTKGVCKITQTASLASATGRVSVFTKLSKFKYSHGNTATEDLLDTIRHTNSCSRKQAEFEQIMNQKEQVDVEHVALPNSKDRASTSAVETSDIDSSKYLPLAITTEAQSSELQWSLPNDWMVHFDGVAAKKIYFNRVTGLSQYDAPIEEKTLTASESSISKLVKPESWDDELTSKSTMTLSLSSWRNPVFSHPHNVSINIAILGSLPMQGNHPTSPLQFTKEMVQSMKVINQVDRKFLACLVDSNLKDVHLSCTSQVFAANILVLVDQHAAHERVRLESLVTDSFEDEFREGQGKLRSTVISPPMKMHISPEEQRLLRSCQHALALHGLHVEIPSHGQPSYVLLHKVPLCFLDKETTNIRRGRSSVVKALVEEYLKEHIQVLKSVGRPLTTLPLTVHNVLASQACHGAIKFNHSLSREECHSLVKSLAACQLPFQCAHGRPSMTPTVDLKKLDNDEQGAPKPNMRTLRRMYTAWILCQKKNIS